MKHNHIKLFPIVLALLICFQVSDMQAQSKKNQPKDFTVYGNVRSEKGIPLMGVSISVQDSFYDTESDENGDFSITIPSIGSVLAFETEYYQMFFQTVTSDGYLNIVMKEAPMGQGARDKVNMPYRTTQKRNVTAAVSTIGSDDLEKSKVTSIGNALSGRLPGMTSRQYSGRPGYDEATFRIRGVRTLLDGASNAETVYGVASPLIIVDGFERNFAELDPAEIESFSVLKDAAATAIYGIRGANGVILVNTKRGETNKRSIDFKYNEGVLTPTDCLPDFVDSYTYAKWYNEARINDGYSPVYTQEDLNLYKSGASPLTHPNNDYYGTFLNKTAPQRKASLAMKGGNQVARYFVVLGYTYQGGLYNFQDFNPDFSTKTNYSRYNIRSNIDVNLTKWLTFTADVAGRIEERKYVDSDTDAIMDALHTPANAYPISFYGIEPNLNKEIFMLGGNSVYKNNPLGILAYKGYAENTRRYYQVTGRLKADLGDVITPGLSAEFSGHLDGYNNYIVTKSRNFLVWQYGKDLDGNDTYTSFGSETSLTAEGSYDTQRYYGMDANIKYSRDFGRHSVNAMLLWTQNLTQFRQNNQADYRFQNFAFWANYSYANKYFLDISGGYSGCDKFYYTNHRRTFTPAVALAWIISEENFMKGLNALDYLKLRASYGLSDNNEYTFVDINSNDERYPARERWWTGSGYQYFGISRTSQTYAMEGRMPNPDVTLEKAAMANLGLEGSLFQHRLNFDLEIWHEHRYDIYTAPLGRFPNVLGLLDGRLPISNDGVVNSQGIEFEASWSDKVGRFSYSIGGNVAYMDSRIIDMSEPFREYDNLVQTGKRVRQDYGLVCLGLFKDWDDIANSPEQQFGTYQPGDLKYKDINGDGIIDTNDFTDIGMGRDPRLAFALNLAFAYRGFDLSLLFQGTGAQSLYAYNDSMRAFYDNGTAQYFMENRYQTYEDGSNNWATATYPRFTSQSNDNNWRVSDYWFKDATFLRLKNAELGYTFPEKWFGKTNLDRARIYVNAYNAFTISHVSEYHLDPEDWLAGSYRYPQTRIFNIGIDLTF